LAKDTSPPEKGRSTKAPEKEIGGGKKGGGAGTSGGLPKEGSSPQESRSVPNQGGTPGGSLVLISTTKHTKEGMGENIIKYGKGRVQQEKKMPERITVVLKTSSGAGSLGGGSYTDRLVGGDWGVVVNENGLVMQVP